MTQNELVSESDTRMTSEIIQAPTDLTTRRIVEQAARFISKKGLEYESKIMADDVRYNFLRSSLDPCHAYYKHKLAEFCAQKQEDDDDLGDMAVIDVPPDVPTLTLVKRMTRLVKEKGLEFEKMVMLRNKDDARFDFLWRPSHPYRDPYLHMLTDFYIKQKGGAPKASDVDIDVLKREVEDGLQSKEFKMLPLPNLLQFRLDKGMTIKERDIVKVTALFTAWYGLDFLGDSRVCQFEFIKESDSRFPLFHEFLVAYSKLLEPPPKGLKDKLRKNAGYKATLFDGFFYRIQSDVLEDHKWLEVGERVIIDWHDSLVKEFANKENQEEPDPKRLKFDLSQEDPVV